MAGPSDTRRECRAYHRFAATPLKRRGVAGPSDTRRERRAYHRFAATPLKRRGELAWRQHDGGHTNGPNFPAFLEWAGRSIGAPGLTKKK